MASAPAITHTVAYDYIDGWCVVCPDCGCGGGLHLDWCSVSEENYELDKALNFLLQKTNLGSLLDAAGR